MHVKNVRTNDRYTTLHPQAALGFRLISQSTYTKNFSVSDINVFCNKNQVHKYSHSLLQLDSNQHENAIINN